MEDLTDIKTLPYLERLINTCVDLVAPEGKYHRLCMKLFYMGCGNATQPSVSSTTVGKKPDESLNERCIDMAADFILDDIPTTIFKETR